MQCGRAQRSDQANGTGLRGDPSFPVWIEEPFRFQCGFEFEKLCKQVALPSFLHTFNHQLQITAGFIHAQFASHFNHFTISGHETDGTGGPFEHGTAYLTAFVLEIEIAMSAGRA